VRKTKEVQKTLKALCDEDDDSDCSDNSSFIAVRPEQKIYNKNLYTSQDSTLKLLEVNLTNLSNENSSASCEQDKQEESKKYQKTRLVDKKDFSYGTKKDSKLATNEKSKLRRNRISDTSDSSDISSSKATKQKYVIRKSKETKNNYINFSDSESENDSINKTSIASTNISKHTTQYKKRKTTNSYNMKSSKDKLKKRYDSSDESEDDINYKKQIKKKSSTNKSYNNKEKREKHKTLKRQFAEIQKNDSDSSSSKEFQKIKIQKVHGDKYSKKQLDLEIDNMKSVNSENEKSEESINEPAISNFNEAKRILKGCKKTCLNFLTYIKSIERYEEKDEEQFILQFTEKINKLKMKLEKKQKDLTTFYQSRFSSSETKKTAKKSHKIVSDDEQSLEKINIHEKQPMNENEHNSENQRESKNVSECDSEEIFSADETKTPQRILITGNKKNISVIEDDMDDINFEVDENESLTDKLKDNDNNSMDLQDKERISPVLNISKAKKIKVENIEGYVKSSNKETQLTNVDSKDKQKKLSTNDIYEISSENSVRNNNKKMTLDNINTDNFTNKTDVINESSDIFDTSLDILDSERNEIETQKTEYRNTEMNCEKTKFLFKTESSDICETSLQNKVPSKEDNASTLIYSDEEKNLSNPQDNNQEKMTFVSINKEKIYDNSKEIDISKKTFDTESVNETEMLAKKALLESDSDTDNTVIDANLAKQISEEDLIIDTRLKKDTEDNSSDVSSNTSTVILSTLTKSKNDAKIKIIDEDKENQLNKKSNKDSFEISQISNETNAKKEQAAKKALLESSSEDTSSIMSSLLESEEIDENKLNIFRENAAAKKALLASSNSESSEMSETEINILKMTKDTKNREINSDENSLITRVKRRKLKLSRNDYYKKDKKLRMFCEVRLERLNEKILKHYSLALKKSREYLEQKALKRYQIFSLKPIYVVVHHLK